MLNINKFHQIDINNEAHPSMFTCTDTYDLFILRLPFFQNEELASVSSAYVFTKDGFYLYKNKDFVDIKGIKGFYSSINERIDIAMDITLSRYNKIDCMEDDFYEGKSINDFNKLWFSMKNDLIKISRVLTKALDEFKKFMQKYKNKENYLEIHFDDLLEHLERSNRKALHGLEKLDALYNFHLTTNNEKMNNTVFILTVLSGIFLPLNLIVGFFGMNTTSLPFTRVEGGTLFVIVILSVTSILSYFLYKKFKSSTKF